MSYYIESFFQVLMNDPMYFLIHDFPAIANLISILIYGAFSRREKKVLVDEREEMIRLKTYEFMNKAQIWTIGLMMIIIILYKEINPMTVLMAMIWASMYTEIAGKIYFRHKY
jgi:hypothetical protein